MPAAKKLPAAAKPDAKGGKPNVTPKLAEPTPEAVIEGPPLPPFLPPTLADEATRDASRRVVKAAAGGKLEELVAALTAAPSAAGDALMAAVVGGHVKAAKVAILRGADPAAALSGSPLAPVHVAAAQGDAGILKELLATETLGGARAAQAPCAAGRTPLMYGAMNGRREIVLKLLGMAGDAAKAGAVDHAGRTAADYARLWKASNRKRVSEHDQWLSSLRKRAADIDATKTADPTLGKTMQPYAHFPFLSAHTQPPTRSRGEAALAAAADAMYRDSQVEMDDQEDGSLLTTTASVSRREMAVRWPAGSGYLTTAKNPNNPRVNLTLASVGASGLYGTGKRTGLTLMSTRRGSKAASITSSDSKSISVRSRNYAKFTAKSRRSSLTILTEPSLSIAMSSRFASTSTLSLPEPRLRSALDLKSIIASPVPPAAPPPMRGATALAVRALERTGRTGEAVALLDLAIRDNREQQLAATVVHMARQMGQTGLSPLMRASALSSSASAPNLNLQSSSVLGPADRRVGGWSSVVKSRPPPSPHATASVWLAGVNSVAPRLGAESSAFSASLPATVRTSWAHLYAGPHTAEDATEALGRSIGLKAASPPVWRDMLAQRWGGLGKTLESVGVRSEQALRVASNPVLPRDVLRAGTLLDSLDLGVKALGERLTSDLANTGSIGGAHDPYGYGLPSPRLHPTVTDETKKVAFGETQLSGVSVETYVRELIGIRAQLPRDKALGNSTGGVQALSDAIERAAATAAAARVSAE